MAFSRSKLHARVLNPDDTVIANAWRGVIGTCECGGYMQAVEPYRSSVDRALSDHTGWLYAECVSCRKELGVPPHHKVLRGSSRRSEQPAGWWDQRFPDRRFGRRPTETPEEPPDAED